MVGMTVTPPPGSPADAAARPAASSRRPRGSRWAWLLGLAAAAGVVALVHAVFVGTSGGQLLEYQVFHAVEDRWGTRSTGPAQRILTVLPVVLAGAATLAALACLIPRRTRRRGVVALVALAGANVGTQALKESLGRPSFANHVPWAGGNSLPSGHTTLAASAAVAALLLVPARWRPAVAVVGAGATALTGSAAYLEAWHRPSDMAAAFGVAAFWAVLVAPWRRAADRRPRHASRAALAVERMLWALGVAGVLVGLGLAVATLGSPAVSADPHPLAAPAGALLSGAPALVLCAALLTGLRRAEQH